MTAALGGGRMESQESRTLGQFESSKFDYRDQQKNLIQLNNAVGYMSAYMRKMQRGIDSANENFIQQIQGFIQDIFTLFAGGGDTGFDFGDVGHLFRMLGALFGFDQGIFPFNLFQAAWHFFSNYIIPVNSFQELMDMIIDGAIASILDIFGEVPILGQALQQLAVILSAVRDAIGPIITAINKIFGSFGNWFQGDFGVFQPLWDGLVHFFSVITGPIETALTPVLVLLSNWTTGFIDSLGHIIGVATNMISSFFGGTLHFDDFIDGDFNILTAIPAMIRHLINNGILGINSILSAFNLPFLPFSHIGKKSVNLLVESGFSSDDAISGGSSWVRDASIGRTAPGAARTTANGFERMLQSVAIPVGEDQKVRASVWVRWVGLAYTGTNPITLDLIRYQDSAELGRTTLATIASPALNQPSWLQYSGEDYSIPNDGTNFVKLQLRVRNTATAGQVWFDDADMRKESDGIPQSWVNGLLDSLGGLGDFIQNVIDGIISAIRGIPFVGGNIANLITWVTGWKTATDDVEEIANDTYIGLDNTQKIMVAAATGSALAPEVIPTAQDMQVMEALESQTQALIATNAQLEKLTTQVTGTVTAGVTVVDPVETVSVGELDPAVWQEFTLEGNPEDGYLESSDGENISMVTPGGNTSTKMYRRIGEGEHTLTNRQRVTVSISRALVYPGFGDLRRPNFAVYCRVSDDGTKWVRAYYNNANALVVDYRNGAMSGQLFNSGEDWTYRSPGAGSSLSIEAGFGTDDRIYRILRGGQPIKIVEDTGLVTDITQRGHGIGMRMQSGYGTAQYNQYTAVDNTPAPVPGTYLHVARLTTASQTIGEGTDIAVYSASPVKQNGIDWNGLEATIKTSDTYTIVVRIKHSSFISNSNQDACVLGIKVDGVLQPLGPSLANGIGGLVGNKPYIMRINALHASFTLPLNAGQKVKPFLYSNNNTSFPCVGDLEGILSYMQITRT